MPRPRTPLSSYGRISVDAVEYVEGESRRRLVVVKTPEKRHGYWRARTRYRFPSGKLRQVERFDVSAAKAEAALRKALTSIQESTRSEVKRETRMQDLGARFLASKANRAPRTVEGYRDLIERVINPRIGDLAISEVTAERLQRLLDVIVEESGTGTAKNTRAVLSGIMGLAVRSDAMERNPVRDLAPIEGKRVGAKPVPLGDLPGILEAVSGDKQLRIQDMADLVEFIAGTGVRISEAIDLDGPDVGITAPAGIPTIGAVVTVRKSKTDAGVRRLTVPSSVAVMLAARPLGEGPLFPTPLGKRRDRNNTSADWQEARERLELGEYSFHSFRKTVATALDQAGLSARDIAEYLGHTDPHVTMRTYMSKTVGGSRAAEALDLAMHVRQV
ncbi:site-specific integrase [Microbacterium murale]|uniref:Phage integrase n=1 Tax=Microbacterium murale TaxID=1081040 RepID=A0ABQ1RV36_9MICO|nr:tyrosine-type recombinase/integrase [Microbacterium murale]GGD83118.1 phage integrase [Microbacterium murale]